jgi:hypothetical protein
MEDDTDVVATELAPVETETAPVFELNYPQIPSDVYEQNLKREDLPEGIQPVRALAYDTAAALKTKNPGLFAEDEDPYVALMKGTVKIPGMEGVKLSDEEILRRFLRNTSNEPMREGSIAQGFKKQIAPAAGSFAGGMAGVRAGYSLQQVIPPTTPWTVAAKFAIPLITGVAGTIAGEEGVNKLREYFFGDQALVVPEDMGKERTGETLAIATSFAPLVYTLPKEAVNFGAKTFLDNLKLLRGETLDQAFSKGPLPRSVAESAFAEAGKKAPLSTRTVAGIETMIGRQGAQAAERPIRQAATEALVVGGTTGGRYASEEYMGGDYAFASELAGAILAPVSGGITYSIATNLPELYTGTKNLLRAIVGKDGGLKKYIKDRTGSNENALIDVTNLIEKQLLEGGEDPETVANVLETMAQNPLFRDFTSGTLSQSPTLNRIESNIASLFPDLNAKGQQSLMQSLDNYKQLIAGFAQVGDSKSLRAVEAAFQNTLEKAFIEQLSEQARRVTMAAERVGSGEADEAVGLALKTNLENALSSARAKERTLYAEIPSVEINVFRDPPTSTEGLGELREYPNVFDFLDVLPESRAALKDLPRPIQTQINFIKEVLEDAGIDTSQLGKRGIEDGIVDTATESTSKIEGRISRLNTRRQELLDALPQATTEKIDTLLRLQSSSFAPDMPAVDKITAVQNDIATLDSLADMIKGTSSGARWTSKELSDVRKILLNRLSVARAEQDLAEVASRNVQRSAEDVQVDEIIDLRRLVSDLIDSGEPISISSTKITENRTRALAADRELSAAGNFNDARLASTFAKLLGQDLTGAIDEIAGEGARASLTAARAFSRALNDVFTRAAAPESLLGTKRTGAETLSPETAVRSLFSGRSDKVYQNAKEIARVGRFLQDEVANTADDVEAARVGQLVGDLQDVSERAIRNIRSVALRARAAGEPDDMTLNAQALEDWMADPNNQSLLGLFPKRLEDDLKNADAAYELLVGSRLRQAEETKAAQARLLFKQLVAKGDETPSETISAALASGKPTFQLNQIADTLAKAENVDPQTIREARLAFKNGLIDWSMRKAMNTEGNLNPTRMYDALFKPMPKSQNQITLAEWMQSKNLMDAEELNTIKTYLAEMRSIQSMASSSALEQLSKEEGPLKDLALRIIGAKIGTTISGIAGGSGASLIAASAGSKAMRALFLSKSGINNMAAFKYLMENPTELAKYLKTPRNARESKNLQDKFANFMMGKGFVLGRRAAVANEGEVEPLEQEKPAPAPAPQPPARTRAPQPRPTAQAAPMQPMVQPTAAAAPMPMQPPAPPPAAANPQQRQQYAAMFPFESTSQMIRGGIGSLA